MSSLLASIIGEVVFEVGADTAKLTAARALDHRRRTRAADAWRSFVAEAGQIGATSKSLGTEQEVLSTIATAPPPALDLLEEGFRAFVDSIDEAAQPFVARLTACYFFRSRARDVFFRKAGRLLSEAHGEEVESLRILGRGVQEHWEAFASALQDPDFASLTLDQRDGSIFLDVSGSKSVIFRLEAKLDGTAILQLLDSHRLVYPGTVKMGPLPHQRLATGTQVVELVRLLGLLGPNMNPFLGERR